MCGRTGGRPTTPLTRDATQLKEWIQWKRTGNHSCYSRAGIQLLNETPKAFHLCLMLSTIAECCLKAITELRVVRCALHWRQRGVRVATMQHSSPAALLNEKPLWPYTCSASRPRQVPKVPTCSSTTCPRSLETRTYSRCSCLSETWSLPKSSSTNRQTLASASVRRQHRRHCVQTLKRLLLSVLFFLCSLCPSSGA